MAEQWEAIFKSLAEQTHAITELIQNSNEGDDLSGPAKEIHEHRDTIKKTAEDAPTEIPDFDDEAAQLDLKNAADIPIIAGNKLTTAFEEKLEFWKGEKDIGKIVKEVVHTNIEMLGKPYPAANPYAPEIMGKTKKLEADSNKLAKQHVKKD